MKVKCENCLSAEAIQPQIFVVATASDAASVKFEESTGTQTSNNLGEGNVTEQWFFVKYIINKFVHAYIYLIKYFEQST